MTLVKERIGMILSSDEMLIQKILQEIGAKEAFIMIFRDKIVSFKEPIALAEVILGDIPPTIMAEALIAVGDKITGRENEFCDCIVSNIPGKGFIYVWIDNDSELAQTFVDKFIVE